MSKEDIVLIGGGGHCKSCIEVIESTNQFNIIGIVDVAEKVGEMVLGYKIIGTDNNLDTIRLKCKSALITLGQTKSAAVRKKIELKLKNLKFSFPVIKSPTAYVSKFSTINEGSIIMHHVFVNAEATIGRHNIINTGAVVEHDVRIGDFAHISTRATLNGGVVVEDECLIGSNACVNHGVKIVSKTIIGSNATVIKNINEKGVYVGSPVKKNI